TPSPDLPTRPAGATLTAGTGIRRPTHERVASDRCAAAEAGLISAAVNGKRAAEVATLTVDVHIEAVKARTAVVECGSHDVANAREQAGDLGLGGGLSGPGEMQLRPPQGLVRGDVD